MSIYDNSLMSSGLDGTFPTEDTPYLIGSVYGTQTRDPNFINEIMREQLDKLKGLQVPKMGQGQAKPKASDRIVVQQAAEDDPYGVNIQEYEPRNYNSLYQTGHILG